MSYGTTFLYCFIIYIVYLVYHLKTYYFTNLSNKNFTIFHSLYIISKGHIIYYIYYIKYQYYITILILILDSIIKLVIIKRR